MLASLQTLNPLFRVLIYNLEFSTKGALNMPVKIDDKIKPGHLYLNDQNQIFELRSYCTQPTATVVNIETDHAIGGAVGSPILDEYKDLDDCEKAELLTIIKNIIPKFKALRDDYIDLKMSYAELKESFADLKLGIAKCKNSKPSDTE